MPGPMSKITYSKEALRDLDEIFDYISKTLHNKAAAIHTVQRIQSDIDKLAAFPEMGPSLSSMIGRKSEYRFLVSGNYIAFYLIGDELVEIARVLYGRRNYMSLLFGSLIEEDSE